MSSIHNYEDRLKLLIARLEGNPKRKFSKKGKKTKKLEVKSNLKLFLDFKDDCIANGNSITRVVRNLEDLLILDNYVKKPLDNCDITDIKSAVAKIEQDNYAENSKYSFKITLKKFYRWLRKTEEYPPEVKWIKPKIKLSKEKLPQELLTEDEILKLIANATSIRDKALISLIYESGCRISEILTLKIKNIILNDYKAIITVEGKTGQRRILIISSTSYLRELINNHPSKDNPESSIWVTNDRNKKQLGYNRVRILIKNIAKKAGIQKKVNPHNFRHSRASFLANHLSDSQLKEYFGWTQSSEMASIYIHLSGKNIDDAILRLHGLKTETKEEENKLKPLTCIRCQEVNPPTNIYCQRCGLALDEEIRANNKRIELMRNTGILEDSINKVNEDLGIKPVTNEELKKHKERIKEHMKEEHHLDL